MPYIGMGDFGVWGSDVMMALTVSMCMKIVYKRGRNICETLIILSSPSELLSGGLSSFLGSWPGSGLGKDQSLGSKRSVV